MTYDKFAEEVFDYLKARFEYMEIKKEEVLKNNGCMLTAYMVGGSNCIISIFPWYLFQTYKEQNCDFTELMEALIKECSKDLQEVRYDVSGYFDYEKIRKMLRGKLINTGLNTEYLKDVPHREILDLSLVYYMEVERKGYGGIAMVVVREKMLSEWNVDEETLYRQTMENMEMRADGTIRSIQAIFLKSKGIEWVLRNLGTLPMYVLTNTDRVLGAVEVLDERNLTMASTMLGGDYWLIPSSLHEFILLPVREDDHDEAFLAKVIREVNEAEVADEEILSYHLYRYRQETGKVEIAA